MRHAILTLGIILFASFAAQAQKSAADIYAKTWQGAEISEETGRVKGFSCSPTGTYAFDPSDKPADCERALKIAIKSKGEGAGYVDAQVPIQKGDVKYTFSCMAKCSAPGVGFIMVKLLDKQGGELKRIESPMNSGTAWEKLEITFQTGDAEKLGLLLRYLQTTDTVGETLLFADPKLSEAK